MEITRNNLIICLILFAQVYPHGIAQTAKEVNFHCNYWSQWSECSNPCGIGVKQRYVVESAVSPTNKTVECTDLMPNYIETVECNNTLKCDDSNCNLWSEWSHCSVSCGIGERRRSKLFPLALPSAQGYECEERFSISLEVEKCYMENCDISKCGQWTSWSHCSATCGSEGVRKRSIQVPLTNDDIYKACDLIFPVSVEVEKCDLPPCNLDDCFVWSPWSACSTTCDEGSQHRFLNITNSTHSHCRAPKDIPMETKYCNMKPCVNPNCNPWSEWSVCSTTCGLGTRERNIVLPQLQNGEKVDKKCASLFQRTKELELCNVGECDANTCTEWSAWSSCSTSCDKGFRNRKAIFVLDEKNKNEQQFCDFAYMTTQTEDCIILECNSELVEEQIDPDRSGISNKDENDNGKLITNKENGTKISSRDTYAPRNQTDGNIQEGGENISNSNDEGEDKSDIENREHDKIYYVEAGIKDEDEDGSINEGGNVDYNIEKVNKEDSDITRATNVSSVDAQNLSDSENDITKKSSEDLVENENESADTNERSNVVDRIRKVNTENIGITRETNGSSVDVQSTGDARNDVATKGLKYIKKDLHVYETDDKSINKGDSSGKSNQEIDDLSMDGNHILPEGRGNENTIFKDEEFATTLSYTKAYNVAGGAIGILLLISLIGGGSFYFYRKRKDSVINENTDVQSSIEYSEDQSDEVHKTNFSDRFL